MNIYTVGADQDQTGHQNGQQIPGGMSQLTRNICSGSLGSVCNSMKTAFSSL